MFDTSLRGAPPMKRRSLRKLAFAGLLLSPWLLAASCSVETPSFTPRA
ncbi:hypothetical protein A7982_13160 [Minicystis rosea]|nr:hypothetical protein A7982_13160 [Minicystis rosea]